jgi:hypothetical protein
MTLREFFDFLGTHPFVLLAYFLAVPITAMWTGWISRSDGALTPWKQLYATLIYLVCVPGVFAAALGVYFFLFERGSIMDTNVLLQILPVVSMVLTLVIIRRNVSFEYIPGFDRISSLITMICAVFALMYLIDRTHIIAWVNVPVQYFLIIVVGLLFLFRYGMKRLIA